MTESVMNVLGGGCFNVCPAGRFPKGNICPIWLGHPLSAHWGADDPAKGARSMGQTEQKFNDMLPVVKRPIEGFLSLLFTSGDRV